MTGFLDREEVDIGGSPMFLTGERLSVVEYISSPTPTRSKFVFQQPKLSYENNLFLLSFKRSLWLGSVVLISMLFLFLFLVTVWEWKRTSIHKRTIRTRNAGILRPNVVDVALLIFGATCQQGSTVELKGSLGRMVLFLLFIMLTFLYTSYSANIVALLQSSSSQIRTLEDLLHSRISFGVHDTVFNRYYFSTETEPVRRAIYEKKVAPPGSAPRFMTMEEGVQEIRKGLFAFHMETGVGYKFVGRYFEEGEKCGLKEIQYLRVIDPWLAVRKETPFKEMFKIGTKRLQEHGLQQRENRLLYEKKPKCTGRQANFISVSMVDCYPALLILSYGTLISISVLFAENLYYNRRRLLHRMQSTEPPVSNTLQYSKMKYAYLFLLAFSRNVCSDEIKMIADVVKSYQQPTSISLKVCWNTAKKKNMVKEIYKIYPPKAVQFIEINDNIVSDSLTNTIIVMDMKCPKTSEFLKKANVTQKFRSVYHWLIIYNSDNVDKNIPSELNDLSILVDSSVLIANKNYNTYWLYSIYKYMPEGNWKVETFGTWTYEMGLKKLITMNIPSSQRRRNLEGTKIGTSMVVNDNDTRMDILSMRNLNTDHLTKAGYRQILPLYYFMNATLITVFTDTWGYLRNGSYDGMIGEVTRGTAELTGTVMFFTKPRTKVLDFLSFPLPSSVRFVFRQPSLSYQNNIFVLPFKPTVWLCILCLIILLLVIVFINGRWENFKCHDIDKTPRSPHLDISEITMMVIGAITQQGSFTEFKGTLGRVVMFLMFFVFLFLHTSYSANIVALLQSSSNDIKTLADLLNSKLELGAEDTPYNRQHLSTASEPIRKAIYEKKIAPAGSKPNFMTLEEGVKRIQTKPFAFHMYLGGGYRLVEKYFLEHEKCGLQEIQFNHETIPWVTCRKNSPYKEIFKIGLLRNQEHGLNDRVNRLIYSRKPVCSVHGGTFGSVNMTDFYPALLMLVYGMIASLLLLAIECLASQRLCHLRNRI
ncbi:ionotropic receptor 75a-like [Danaus plexippus]|uniref:ionotropic receptor 75a-like n=1 Tax=Danaus plexippus TaxID=13037 RepID=UPI002AAFB7E9|nr:ionotropic receptor 75a-like [Danaus plexippus]